MKHLPKSNRKAIFNAGLIPNIKENPRNRKTPKCGRKRLFNKAIHALRERVERTFAWEDKFKRLLLRFEYHQRRAQHAGQCGVEVEGGTVPTRDWFLNLQILTSGGFR